MTQRENGSIRTWVLELLRKAGHYDAVVQPERFNG